MPHSTEVDLGFAIKSEPTDYTKYIRNTHALSWLLDKPEILTTNGGVLTARFVSIWEISSKK